MSAPKPACPAVLGWDWKTPPSAAAVRQALEQASGGLLRVYEVDTGGDDYAVVLSAEPLNEAQVTAVYEMGELPD